MSFSDHNHNRSHSHNHHNVEENEGGIESKPQRVFSLEQVQPGHHIISRDSSGSKLGEAQYSHNINNHHGYNHEEQSYLSGGQTVTTTPRKSLLFKLHFFVKTCIFADDSFRHFNSFSRSQQCLLLLQNMFPILEWGTRYNLHLFKADLMSGLTIASLAIPQGISYAKLAGLPPIVGLYSSFLPPLVYAIFGTSRDIAVGTVAVVSILIRSFLWTEASNPALHSALAFTATFFAGVFQASLGFFRLGFLLDFLSHATIVGFMAAAAGIVSLQQLKGLLGIQHFSTKTDVVSVIHSVVTTTNEWNWPTATLGFSFLLLLLIARHFSRSRKNLYWISALMPLCCVILSTLIVFLTRLDKRGVEIIGKLKGGLNPPSAGMLILHGEYAIKAMKIGFICGLIALTEAMAVGRTFASLKGYNIHGNKEMMAIGFMNIAGSCTSCYVTTGALCRSAVNHNAGCKTAVSNIVMSIVIMITLLFLMPLFIYTPTAVLSAILVVAVINLVDVHAIHTIWKVDKVDFIALLCAFLGVLFISPEIGLLLSVLLSIIRILVHVTRPHTAVLGRIPGTGIYRNVEQYMESQIVLGFLIVRIDAPIYFSNATYIRERMLKWASDEEERAKEAGTRPIQFVVLDLSPVTSIDITGVHMLEELNRSLKNKQLQLVLANPGSGVVKKLEIVGFIGDLGPEWLFLTVADAIDKCSAIMGKMPSIQDV